ncbi:hypothetical protein D9M71_47860 [compost metagenome]
MVAGFLRLHPAVRGEVVEADIVQQRVVGFQVTVQCPGPAIVQAHLEPPDRSVLAHVGLFAPGLSERRIGELAYLFQAEFAPGVFEVADPLAERKSQLVLVQWYGLLGEGGPAEPEQKNGQTECDSFHTA